MCTQNGQERPVAGLWSHPRGKVRGRTRLRQGCVDTTAIIFQPVLLTFDRPTFGVCASPIREREIVLSHTCQRTCRRAAMQAPPLDRHSTLTVADKCGGGEAAAAASARCQVRISAPPLEARQRSRHSTSTRRTRPCGRAPDAPPRALRLLPPRFALFSGRLRRVLYAIARRQRLSAGGD